MNDAAPEVCLLVPGWRESDARALTGDTAGDWRLHAPAHNALAGRALPGQPHTAEEILLAAFDMPVDDPGQVPAAALLCDEPGAVCMEPVHVLADRDHARLVSGAQLAIRPDEARALADAVNALVAGDGCRVTLASATRWYFQGLSATHPGTWPTHAIVQRNTGPFMPRGVDGAPWRTLLTEIQMLFHTHPVNEQRSREGRQTINGVWFWGGAALPPHPPSHPGGRGWYVLTDDPFATALAAWCGHATAGIGERGDIGETALAEHLQAAADAHCNLLWIDTGCYDAWLAADADAMSGATGRIAAMLSGPLREALDKGWVARVAVHTGEGAVQVLGSGAGSDGSSAIATGALSPGHWLRRIAAAVGWSR